ncbi:MAG TPA: beta-N-acetylhexosaminidase, partial [Opitutaceae bacterium]
MASPSFQLIPSPHSINRKPGSLRLDPIREIVVSGRPSEGTHVAARQLAAAMGGATGVQPAVVERRGGASPAVLHVAARGPRGAHTISIDPDGLRVSGDAEGVFHGVQTLRQLIAQRGARLPALEIEDAPDFAVRGFYHDISRGKVPRLDTLMALAEKMAHYKLNQLQLYVEHTFAFRDHPDIWAGSDPLTADDILALDEHCARHHVELVPSLSTFGHFYTALVSPAKQHLNELPLDGSKLPFSWWDRMGHYTLDCLNPESIELVRGMIHEMRPLFRSRFFNICCDETFDLGRGRNAAAAGALGTGRLYVDFLVRIMACVHEAKAVPMFWGDIIGNHPELVSRIPRDAIALDWSYSADLAESKSRLFKRARRQFYVCPGTSAWDRWMS